ncbi:MAG: hypothetical protein N3F67_03535 [Acidilobaceae archaeon]|nr:hypothetical protein [Acidilobaceae archaeon]
MTKVETVKKYRSHIILVLILLALVTLLPDLEEEESFLGYDAHCPFSPISTVLLLILAAVVYYFTR